MLESANVDLGSKICVVCLLGRCEGNAELEGFARVEELSGIRGGQ